MLKILREKQYKIEMQSEDEKILRENTVDFIAFSYYTSRLASSDPNAGEKSAGNVITSLKIHI